MRRGGLGYADGREPVAIDDLISPLRYDVLIRQHYFEFLDEHHQLVERRELPRLIELSRSHPYYTWYVDVDIPRFNPHRLGDPERLEGAFEAKVAKVTELYRSFQESGYDRRQPITLETGRVIEPTDTGKRLARRLYVGDGCHRLALLRLRGVALLEPDIYRVHHQRRFTPWDVTSRVLRAVPIGREAYWQFLSLSYGDLVAVERTGSQPSLEAGAPELLAELHDVASRDAPFLAD